MGKFKLIVAVLLCGLIVACNFTEEIHFKKDGSGKMNIHFDGNEMMAALGAMGDSTAKEEVMDSTIVFKDFFEKKADSIAKLPLEEQEKLKKLEPFSLHIAMDAKEEKLSFDLFSEFKNVSEVNDAFNTFQEASALGPKPGKDSPSSTMPSSEPATKVSYSFSKNVFTRKTEIIDQELFQKGLDSLQGTEMFLSGSTYTFKYHFPSRVKSTNVEGATFSMDGKTMIYEVNFLEMMKNPEGVEIEVELEK
ncbi:MAG: hypothetical protein AAF717_19460 [Bacteroidota bacterium]